MNHVYRSVWNEVSRTFVAVAETVRRHAKSGSAKLEQPEGETAQPTGAG